MENIKRLILCSLPVQKCNLKCDYCYISQTETWDEPSRMKYPIEHIVKCLSYERLGGSCLINLTGYGETLLQPEIDLLVKGLIKNRHYIEIVTNGLLGNVIKRILDGDETQNSRVFFKLSFHYKQLKERGLLKQFWDNAALIKSLGASFTIELMANDSIEDDIQDIIDECKRNVGAVCQATIGRDDSKVDKRLLSSHSVEEYHEIWEKLESPMLDFKLKVLGIKRKEFCYAGEWSLLVDLYTGNARSCYKQPVTQNIFENSDKPIDFSPVGHNCSLPYCMNAHAHMVWGIIPEISTPTYCQIRNRRCVDGTEWLNKGCKQFFSSKLYENNAKYGVIRQRICDFVHLFKCGKGIIVFHDYNMAGIKKYIKRSKNG